MSEQLSLKQRASLKFRGIPFTLSCGNEACNQTYPTHECEEGERKSTTPGYSTVFTYTCPKGHEVFAVELE